MENQPYRPFSKVLIANRGEIAVRLLKACRERGLATVAVYSDADRQAPHVKMADEAVHIGAAPSRESYLNSEAILQAAARTGAEAIHPGYGFLAENAEFAQACLNAGLVWIGPQPEAIRMMGSKSEARALAERLEVPVIPGWQPAAGESGDDQSLIAQADKIGYPVLLKAVAGGGGRGMRRVEAAADLPAAIAGARREALQAFGDDSLYLEKYLTSVRHIEVQILGDSHGKLLHCFERECSLQRRFQKVVEESPSPLLTSELRQAMGEAAVRLGQALGYCGAGTVEFVLDQASGGFYFLEVNTRLQVEHPITEMVTGQDLVHWQLKLAAGEPLALDQGEIPQLGHAIEVRICAEDPAAGFRPGTGRVLAYAEPEQTGVRCDSGLAIGSSVPVNYDSMLAKLIVWGHTRTLAIQRLRSALSQTVILGLQTNLDFLQKLAAQPAFAEAAFDTGWIEQHLEELLPVVPEGPRAHELAIVATLWSWRRRQQERPWQGVPSGWRNSPGSEQQTQVRVGEHNLTVFYTSRGEADFAMRVEDTHYSVCLLESPSEHLVAEIDGLRRKYTLAADGDTLWLHAPALGTHALGLLPRFAEAGGSEGHAGYKAVMTAKVLQLLVAEGQSVEAGQPLLVMESMKMESTLCAAASGIVTQVLVSAEEVVEAGATLLVIEQSEPQA